MANQTAQRLRSRFFNEISEKINSDIDRFHRAPRLKRTRAGWDRFAATSRECLKDSMLFTYEGGSKRAPYLFLGGMHIERNRPFNTWKEHCLRGVLSYVTLNGGANGCLSPFSVGEHAIARLIERGKIDLITNRGEFEVARILPSLKSIPVWSAFWTRLLIVASSAAGIEFPLRPVVPTEYGLFMCEMSYDKNSSGRRVPILEVRTFLENESLSPLQCQIRDVLLNVVRGMEASPLSGFPIVSSARLDEVEYLERVMYFRMLSQADAVSKILFHHVENNSDRYEFRREFIQYVKHKSEGMSENWNIGLDFMGVRDFQSMLRRQDLTAVRDVTGGHTTTILLDIPGFIRETEADFPHAVHSDRLPSSSFRNRSARTPLVVHAEPFAAEVTEAVETESVAFHEQHGSHELSIQSQEDRRAQGRARPRI